jgi:hypothetical protein
MCVGGEEEGGTDTFLDQRSVYTINTFCVVRQKLKPFNFCRTIEVCVMRQNFVLNVNIP